MVGSRPRWPGILTALLLLATLVAVRAVRTYRPFPSIDDFTYVPLAWAWQDPSLYPRDTLLRAFVQHTPAWDFVVIALDHTVGEAVGFWALTIALTMATLAAVARLLRATGVSILLLPLVVAIGFCGPVIGYGRGAYDGALGDGFHVQWLALCALIWAYDAFVRDRMQLAGLWLGASALAHPVVAAHGALSLGVASLVAGDRRWARFPQVAGVALLVSLPVSVPLVRSLLGEAGAATVMSRDIVRLGYEFRAPHHYLPSLTPASTWWYLGLMIAGGIGAAFVPRIEPARRPTRALAGLLAGHAVLVLAGVALYGDALPARWRYASSVPYLLDLSRTSGLILPLAAVLLVGAIERRFVREGKVGTVHELLWTGLLAVTTSALLLYVGWQLPLAGLVMVTLGVRLAPPSGRLRGALFGLLALIVALGLVRIEDDTKLRAPLSSEEAGLYRWARTTAPQSLFVIPPGLQAFRFYARRSVYVDFKLFPPATPTSAPEWRHRMELVAAPDSLALKSPGWLGVPQWDRTYANRNTPGRIVQLLGQTGADYLVWDRSGLDVPPYVPVNRVPAPGAVLAYSNARFEVYALPGDSH
jgi:hypothetical protein